MCVFPYGLNLIYTLPHTHVYNVHRYINLHTADFIKKGTFSVHSFNDDYLSIPLSAQVARSTFFMKSPVH